MQVHPFHTLPAKSLHPLKAPPARPFLHTPVGHYLWRIDICMYDYLLRVNAGRGIALPEVLRRDSSSTCGAFLPYPELPAA